MRPDKRIAVPSSRKNYDDDDDDESRKNYDDDDDDDDYGHDDVSSTRDKRDIVEKKSQTKSRAKATINNHGLTLVAEGPGARARAIMYGNGKIDAAAWVDKDEEPRREVQPNRESNKGNEVAVPGVNKVAAPNENGPEHKLKIETPLVGGAYEGSGLLGFLFGWK